MGKSGDADYHKLENHTDPFASYLCWVQFLRAVMIALLVQTLWPYLDFLEANCSPLDFVRTVVFATLVEVFAAVWQVKLDPQSVTFAWYAFSYTNGVIGSLLYAFPAQIESLLPQYVSKIALVIIGRMLIAFWVGSSGEIERSFVRLSSLSEESHTLLGSFERMRIAGYLSGSLLGLASTYLPQTWSWFEVKHISYPAGIQTIISLVALCWFLSVYSKFKNAVNGEKETDGGQKTMEWEKKKEGCGKDDRDKITYVSESLRHWGVFSGLFSNIVLHFSSQVRDVVFPLLLLPDSSEFSHTHVDNQWGLTGLYALFAAGSLVGFFGREMYILMSRVISDRVALLLFLLLTGIGWTLLLPSSDPEKEESVISLHFVISGFVLVSLGQNSLPECSYRIFHGVLGPKTSGFYMVMFLLLGGMGATIAPLWVWETMRLDSALCFGFVNVWLGAMIIILIASWSEAVPYNDFMSRFVENFKQKGKIEAS